MYTAYFSDMNSFEYYFLAITVVATALIGGLFLVTPALIPDVFTDVQLGQAGEFFLRFFGCTMFGYSALNYSALQNIHDESFVKIVAVVNLVSLSLGIIVSAIGIYTGVLAHFAWLFVAEHVFFWAGFAAILLRK